MAAPFLRSGQLIRELERWSTAVQGLFLFYHGRRQVPTALRAFIDMVRAPKSITGRRSLKKSLLIRELQYLSQIQFFHRELQPAR